MNTKNLLIATIAASHPEGGRVKIVCQRDGDRLRWYGVEGADLQDTEVSVALAAGIEAAKLACHAAWGAPCWELRPNWR